MDNCPNGDHSPSYYDRSCGTPTPQPDTSTDPELLNAYQRALKHNITTQFPIDNARLLDYLTRAELAKMLSVFTLNFTDKQPITNKPGCDLYTDTDQVNTELAAFIKQACELEIMGLHSDGKTPLTEFMPNKFVSRAELVTVLSRVLYGNLYDNYTTDNRREGHMQKLHQDNIIKDTNPLIQEVRAYVLLMMFRLKGIQ